MIKKYKILLFFLFIMAGMFIFSVNNVSATEIVEQGNYGEEISWVLDEEGKLSVKGEGSLTLEAMKSIPDAVQNKTIHLSIEDGIIEIKERAGTFFGGYKRLTIAGSVKRIEDNAFSYVYTLESVYMNEGIEYLGHNTFLGCDKLNSILLANSITELAGSNFYDCTELKEIKLPDCLEKIGHSVFSNCQSLEKIEFGDKVKILGNNVFYNCNKVNNVVFPDSVETIGSSIFKSCDNLKDIVIGENAINVSKKMLKDCPTVKKIVNNSDKAVWLDDAKGNRAWYVKKKKVKKVPAGKKATAKGKKYSITYNVKGGKIKEKAVKSYRYGDRVELPQNVKRKGSTFFGWGIKNNVLEPGRKGNYRLEAEWKIYSVKNIKGQRFKVYAQDADYMKKGYDPSDDIYGVRYSEDEDMSDCKYFWRTAQNKSKDAGCSPKLEIGKTYYVEIMCVPSCYDDIDVELEDDIIGVGWTGKRKVTIEK